jgi:hypothetical protein
VARPGRGETATTSGPSEAQIGGRRA